MKSECDAFAAWVASDDLIRVLCRDRLTGGYDIVELGRIPFLDGYDEGGIARACLMLDEASSIESKTEPKNENHLLCQSQQVFSQLV